MQTYLSGGESRETCCYERLVFFIVSELKILGKNAQSFGESDMKSRLWLKELHLKYLCAPCYFLLCNDVLAIYGIYLLFSNDPHQQYLLCVKVLGLKCRFFFNASKILFYILTYTVCLVFKGIFANKYEEKYWCIWAAEGFERSLDIFSCITHVFKLSFNKLLQSKNFRKGVFLIDE